jgi:hypothetical protein
MTCTARCTASSGSNSKLCSPQRYQGGADIRRAPRRALCCRAPCRRNRSQWISASDMVPFNSKRSLSSGLVGHRPAARRPPPPGNAAQHQQAPPVVRRPRHPRHVEREHGAGLAVRDRASQPGKAAPRFRRRSRARLVLVDDLDRLGRPAQRERPLPITRGGSVAPPRSGLSSWASLLPPASATNTRWTSLLHYGRTFPHRGGARRHRRRARHRASAFAHRRRRRQLLPAPGGG